MLPMSEILPPKPTEAPPTDAEMEREIARWEGEGGL